jgi:hypothetical protein
MNKRAILLSVVAICLIATTVVTEYACAPPSDTRGGAESRFQEYPLEKECERELLYLDGLIESSRRTAAVSPAALAEAVELRRAAVEFILDEEYELALELIDDAIALLTTRA